MRTFFYLSGTLILAFGCNNPKTENGEELLSTKEAAGLSVICHAQDTPQILFLRESDPPEHKLPLLVFRESIARDTVRGVIIVGVEFNEYISNPVISVKNVELRRLILTDQKNVNIDYRKYDKPQQMNCIERELFDRYKNKFIHMYFDQPYCELRGRQHQIGNKLGFSYKFIIVPDD